MENESKSVNTQIILNSVKFEVSAISCLHNMKQSSFYCFVFEAKEFTLKTAILLCLVGLP